MKKTMKRITAFCLSLALLICMIPNFSISAKAATGYELGYTGAMAGDGKIYTHGLDVSAWQDKTLDFQNFKNAGYSYVILRCGTTKGKDANFETFYTNAKAAGLDVGVYYYSYATSVEGAKADATNCLSWISGKKLEYPVYFDYEDPSQSSIDSTTAANICYAFMDMFAEKGYLVGLYSMASWLEQSWITSSGIRDKYEGWVAHYPSSDSNTGITSTAYNKYNATYNTRYGMYQYSSTTYVNSAGPFDANVCYKDYPGIVKQYGFNGYPAENYHTITFDSNGGSAVESVSVKDGETLAAPANPTRYGFDFIGWYCNPELTDPYDFSTPVPYSFTLYAKWEEAYWGANTNLMPVQDKLVLEDFQSTGQYIWPYYNDDGSVTMYNGVTNDGNWSWPSAHMPYQNSVDSGNDAYIYAKYSSTAQFNATIDYLDADGNPQSVSLSRLAGNGDTDFPAGNQEILVNFGQYVYDQGHLTPSDGSAHSRNVKYTKVTYYVVGGLDQYVRLYDMRFTPVSTIRFVSNGGSEVSAIDVANGATLTAPAAPTRLGFDFAGWYCNPELTDPYDFSTPVNYDFNLYAKWTEAAWPAVSSLLPVQGHLVYDDFQGTGESVWDYYNDDGSVTLYNTVDAVEYSWPSGHMVYENAADLNAAPYLHLNFRCDAGFNCEIEYLDDNGQRHSVNLSDVAGLETTDFEAGSYDLYLDFAAYLESQEHTPASGKLKITKVTYYVVGSKDSYARLYDLAFTADSGAVEPVISLSYPSLSFEGEVFYNVYFTTENLDVAVEDMGLLTWYEKPASLAAATFENAEYTIPGAVYSSANGTYMVRTQGIPAKNLGDDLYLRVYAKLSDGSYVYSNVTFYNAKYYANDILTNSQNADMKSLVVAMLNYGAAAQVHFDHNADSLMNAGLTDAQKALVKNFSSDMISTVVTPDSAKTVNFKSNGGFSNGYPSVSFDGAFSINYYLLPKYAVEGEMTLYCWDLATYNSVSALTEANATAKVTMAPASNPAEHFGNYTGIAAKQIDETVFVAGVYTSGGVRYSSPVITYSLGSYCKDQIANGSATMQDFAKATVVYGDHAENYFTSLNG